MNESILLILVFFINFVVIFFLPSVLWYAILIRLKSIIRNPFLRVFSVFISGLLLFQAVVFLGNFVIPDLQVTWYIEMVLLVWGILTYSQFNIDIVNKLLEKNRRLLIIAVQIVPTSIGLLILFLSLQYEQLISDVFIFIGFFLFIRNLWFIFMQLFERVVTGQWAAYKANILEPNLVVSVDFRMSAFSAIFDRLSEIFWIPSLRFIWWPAMIITTAIEIVWFIIYGAEIFTQAWQAYSYLTILAGFFFTSIFMTMFHEWGHLIAAKANNGFGAYKEKLIIFITTDAVQIPLLLFTPKERIKIALMGTLWANLFAFFPMLILIFSYLHSPILFNSLLGLITLNMSLYAILGTVFFILSIWPGGDMNNFLRDIYLIWTDNDTIPESIFSSTSEIGYSLVNKDFQIDQKAYYRFPTPVLLRSIGEDSYYMLDEKNYCAFVINESAFSITKIIANQYSFTLTDVLSAIQKEFDIPNSQLIDVAKDIIVYLTYLGRRGYLELSEPLWKVFQRETTYHKMFKEQI